jgi:hypothetical protein
LQMHSSEDRNRKVNKKCEPQELHRRRRLMREKRREQTL